MIVFSVMIPLVHVRERGIKITSSTDKRNSHILPTVKSHFDIHIPRLSRYGCVIHGQLPRVLRVFRHFYRVAVYPEKCLHCRRLPDGSLESMVTEILYSQRCSTRLMAAGAAIK